MSLKVVRGELIADLDRRAAQIVSDGYKIGLFQNNHVPTDLDVFSDLVVCDFSGYAGEQLLAGFSGAAWSSPRATTTGSTVIWTHNGGGTSNTVYGYYIVDGAGNLAWLEKRTGVGVVIGSAGQSYTVYPTLTRRSEF